MVAEHAWRILERHSVNGGLVQLWSVPPSCERASSQQLPEKIRNQKISYSIDYEKNAPVLF